MANDRIRECAESLLAGPVRASGLALAFEESAARSTDLMVGGPSFFPRMLEDIASATSSVHVNQFGFRPGVVGEAFAEALAAKAASGIPVRLVVDRWRSNPHRHSRMLYEELAEAGVSVCVVRATQLRVQSGPMGAQGPRHWNLSGIGHFDHRKVLVIDGRVGWIGGAGIEDHFLDGRFHDLFLRVTGPVVNQLQLVFLATLRWLGGTVPAAELDALLPTNDAGVDPTPAVVLSNAPGRHRPITEAIAELIDGARDTLDITNPYVVDRTMIGRIADAARRGARVRLFVPANSDNFACRAAQHHHHDTLLDAGVRVLEHPAMLHAKAFVRDGQELLIGTCNLDAWSLKRSLEIDIRVRSQELAEQFDERFAVPAEELSAQGSRLTGARRRAGARFFAAISPLL